MSPQVTLARYDPALGPVLFGYLWTLNKGDAVLAVSMTTHPLGWELRLLSNGTRLRSQVCKTGGDVLGISETWHTEAAAKGWS